MKVFCFLTHKVKVKYTKEITIATIVGDTGLENVEVVTILEFQTS